MRYIIRTSQVVSAEVNGVTGFSQAPEGTNLKEIVSNNESIMRLIYNTPRPTLEAAETEDVASFLAKKIKKVLPKSVLTSGTDPTEATKLLESSRTMYLRCQEKTIEIITSPEDRKVPLLISLYTLYVDIGEIIPRLRSIREEARRNGENLLYN
jgi:hypothetical protein